MNGHHATRLVGPRTILLLTTLSYTACSDLPIAPPSTETAIAGRNTESVKQIIAALQRPGATDGTLIIGLKRPDRPAGVSRHGVETTRHERLEAQRALAMSFPWLEILDGVEASIPVLTSKGHERVTFDRTAIRVRFVADSSRLSHLLRSPFVDYVQPNRLASALGGVRSRASVTTLALLGGEQRAWGIDTIRAPQLWSAYTGYGVGLLAAETGFDMPRSGVPHPDMPPTFAFSGYTADQPDNRCPSTWPSACGSEDPFHGTGVIGAAVGRSNDSGAVGVAFGSVPETFYMLRAAKIAYVTVDGDTAIPEFDFADAVVELSSWNASANYPIGVTAVLFPDDTTQANHLYLHDAFRRAYYEYDVLWFAAANANRIDGPVLIPARFPEVVAVGSVSRVGGSLVRAPFSPIDPKVELVAPGYQLVVPWNRDDDDPNAEFTKVVSGNSFAVGLAAGVARLAMQAHPNWTAGDLRNRMQLYARTLGAPSEYGAGLVDAVGLVREGPINCPPLIGSIVGPSKVRPSTTCRWSISPSGGEPPYSYRWTVNGAVVGTNSPELTYRNTFANGSSFTVTVQVTDATNTTLTRSKSVQVSSTAALCFI